MYYEYVVPHGNRLAGRISLVCLLGGAALYLTSLILRGYAGILQALSLGLFCAAILFLSRYTLKKYTYRLALPDSTEDWPASFSVIEQKGGRRTVLAQINLAQIQGLLWEEKTASEAERAALKEKLQGRKPYTYTVDFRPDRVLCLLCNDGSAQSGYTDGDDLVLRLTPDDYILRHFERAAAGEPFPGDPAAPAHTED